MDFIYKMHYIGSTPGFDMIKPEHMEYIENIPHTKGEFYHEWINAIIECENYKRRLTIDTRG